VYTPEVDEEEFPPMLLTNKIITLIRLRIVVIDVLQNIWAIITIRDNDKNEKGWINVQIILQFV